MPTENEERCKEILSKIRFATFYLAEKLSNSTEIIDKISVEASFNNNEVIVTCFTDIQHNNIVLEL